MLYKLNQFNHEVFKDRSPFVETDAFGVSADEDCSGRRGRDGQRRRRELDGIVSWGFAEGSLRGLDERHLFGWAARARRSAMSEFGRNSFGMGLGSASSSGSRLRSVDCWGGSSPEPNMHEFSTAVPARLFVSLAF